MTIGQQIASAGRGRSRRRADGVEDTRAALLKAARRAFAEKGLEGARVDDIARRAGANKQLVYHYFGSKDALYTEVLESVYQEIRTQEQALDLDVLPPLDAMRRLIEFSFDYLAQNPDFVALLADENAHHGRHLAASPRFESMNRPIIDMISHALQRGVAAGVFRPGLDPLQVYVSIAGLGYFYFANSHTLSHIFGSDLSARQAVEARRRHVLDFVLAALTR